MPFILVQYISFEFSIVPLASITHFVLLWSLWLIWLCLLYSPWTLEIPFTRSFCGIVFKAVPYPVARYVHSLAPLIPPLARSLTTLTLSGMAEIYECQVFNGNGLIVVVTRNTPWALKANYHRKHWNWNANHQRLWVRLFVCPYIWPPCFIYCSSRRRIFV